MSHLLDSLSPSEKFHIVSLGIKQLHQKLGLDASSCIPMMRSSYSDTLTLLSGKFYIWYNRPLSTGEYTSGCVECKK